MAQINAPERAPAPSARIYRLEQRLNAIEPKINEMHEILVGLRAIGRAARLIAYWVGGPSLLLGLAAAAWKWLPH